MINRIHIVGASGSGTTTLSAELSGRLGYKHLDTDNFFWEDTDPKFQEKRPVEERLKLIRNEIIEHRRWILSGSLCGWGDPLIPHFDLVIFLRIPKALRISRLLEREKERYGDNIEKGGSWHEKHLEFMEWASKYDDGDESVRSFLLHNNWLNELDCEILRIEQVLELDEKVELVSEFIKSLEARQ